MRHKKLSFYLLGFTVLLVLILSVLWLDHSSRLRIACMGISEKPGL